MPEVLLGERTFDDDFAFAFAFDRRAADGLDFRGITHQRDSVNLDKLIVPARNTSAIYIAVAAKRPNLGPANMNDV